MEGNPFAPENKNSADTIYTDPILVFFGTEIAYAPKQFFSALLRSFSGPKRMIFHFQPVRQKSCRIKPKLFQYNNIIPCGILLTYTDSLLNLYNKVNYFLCVLCGFFLSVSSVGN